MPRTKISKTCQLLRQVSTREDKIRELEASFESYLNAIESKGQAHINAVQESLRLLMQRTNSAVLKLPMGTFLKLNLRTFDDFQPIDNSSGTSAVRQVSKNSRNTNDDGYVTETSTHGGGTSSTQQLRSRTPGPLDSARARRPHHRRSISEEYAKPKPKSKAPHLSRSNIRTPIGQSKAFSADRTPQMDLKQQLSPPAAIMRWPKPGEIVLSECGSPIVAQIMRHSYANVNIPVRDGMLFLRPKKLGEVELKSDIIESIDSATMDQIRTLQANLNLIIIKADKMPK